MKKIIFHTKQMSFQGTEIVLYDYALNNRDILGNESIIVYDASDMHNENAVIEKFRQQFPVYAYQNFAEVDRLIARKNIDLFYAIKHGKRDEVMSNVVPSMIHAIFPRHSEDFHGAAYAFVSDWLADTFSNRKVPVVPHIVSLPEINANLRDELGIPADAMVFGFHGGANSFDLEFVKNSLGDALQLRSNLYFLFLNIAPFMQHERVIFLPGSADISRKVKFINSCDAMLHARRYGETFGLACGEFSIRNKPVLTYANSGARNHISVLGKKAFLYSDTRSLMELLINLTSSELQGRDWDCYSQRFSSETVMSCFKKELIDIAVQRGIQKESGIRLGMIDKVVVRRNWTTWRKRKRQCSAI